MKSLKLNSFEISKAVVPLGVQGENGTRYVYYDATELIEDLGAGDFSYYFQPEGIPAYPMSETWRSGNNLCVTLTASDTAVAGKGLLQFAYKPSNPANSNIKTVELATFIAPALGDSGDVPDPWETYLDRMEAAAETASDAADRAEVAAASVESPVSYAPQTLTPAQQGQARTNISAGMTSRNILDNPFFTINQRGASTVGVSSYGVDRWKTASTTKYTVASDGITMESTSGNALISQTIEGTFWGKAVTLSAIINDELYTASGTLPSSAPSSSQALVAGTARNSLYLRLYWDGTRMAFAIISTGAVSNKMCKAVKLEIGTVSTLLNDSMPNYAEELAKCQRYFVKFANTTFSYAFGYTLSNQKVARLHIPLPAPMRAKPTMTVSSFSSALLFVTNVEYHPTSVSVDSLVGNMLCFNATCSETLPSTATMCAARFSADVSISADF